MSLTKKPVYIHEPTDLQCGQAVLAMLSDKSVEEIIQIVGTDRETTLADMKKALTVCGINFADKRTAFEKLSQLPRVAVLSLETPRCWHWSLFFDGTVYDPEHGKLDHLPECNRKYYWKINE